MKTFLKIFCLLSIFVFASVEACTDSVQAAGGLNLFQKDEFLVERLREKKIRLFVISQNQSLNNFLDIVSSSRSPGYGLTDRGIVEANTTAQNLLPENISIIYTSPLFRTMQGTNIYGKVFNLPPEKLVVEDLLVIQNFGMFEGSTYEDYKGFFTSFEDMLTDEPLEGESGASVFERTRRALWKIVQGSDVNVLVVTHAFNFCHVKMCLTGEFGNLPGLGEYQLYDFSQQ